MKASAKVNANEGVINITFDLFEALWEELLQANVALMADSESKNLFLFSFASGKGYDINPVSEKDIKALESCNCYRMNFVQGSEYTEIIKDERIDVSGNFMTAIEAQFAKNNASATEGYKKVIESCPDNFRAYNLLGRCLRVMGNSEAACECYQKAIELAPWSPEAYSNLGVLFQKRGEEVEAQECFKRAIELDNFYFNALIKRIDWLWDNEPNSEEFKLVMMRLTRAHGELTSVKESFQAYLKKTGLSRFGYADKESLLFGDFADKNLQLRLRIIENQILNGAFGAALKSMTELKAEAENLNSKDKVLTWIHERTFRIINRLESIEATSLKDKAEKLAAEIAAQKAVVTEKKEPTSQTENATTEEESIESVKAEYEAPIKGIKPVTIIEFFMMILHEVVRDGEIDEAERTFLKKLKDLFKISDKDFTKMFDYVKNQVKTLGIDRSDKGNFDPKRLFKNLCDAALRDGVLEESEKKILGYCCKIFKISESEAKEILAEASK